VCKSLFTSSISQLNKFVARTTYSTKNKKTKNLKKKKKKKKPLNLLKAKYFNFDQIVILTAISFFLGIQEGLLKLLSFYGHTNIL
jgi:hypothetical protein